MSLIDVIRVGSAREINLASKKLSALILEEEDEKESPSLRKIRLLNSKNSAPAYAVIALWMVSPLQLGFGQNLARASH